MTPRVLSIAGTDPTGGAGIQADLKSIGALGGYGMAVVTALVAQNTHGVRAVHVPPVAFLVEQLDAVSDDVTIDAVKLGMLHSTPLIDAVAAWLDRVRPPIVVLDPVMVATSGDRLLDAEAEAAVRRLCRRVDLVTPNLPELAVLVDADVAKSWAEAVTQAAAFAESADTTVLLKGGHLDGDVCTDAIVTPDAVHEIESPRIVTSSTHGTGCSLSSAMATLAAQGLPWLEALERAKPWLAGAIEHGAALDVGSGNGPVDHFHELRGWTARVWQEAVDTRGLVDACDFIRGLGDGSLETERFTWYLGQDALYLHDYADLLTTAADNAVDADEQQFWSSAAQSARDEVTRLHQDWIGRPVEPAPATRAYLDHLRSTSLDGDRGTLIAALLPCFWVYADVGSRLVIHDHPDHPYGSWLRLYADPAFAESTRTARALVDRAAILATPDQRQRMRDAFLGSMRHELAFFQAPLRL